MEENKIKTDFAYTDEFGNESRLAKTFTDAVLMDRTDLEFLVDEFKSFLKSMGFTNTDCIQIIEEEE